MASTQAPLPTEIKDHKLKELFKSMFIIRMKIVSKLCTYIRVHTQHFTHALLEYRLFLIIHSLRRPTERLLYPLHVVSYI